MKSDISKLIERLEPLANEAVGWKEDDLFDDTCAQCRRGDTSEWGILGIAGGYHAAFGNEQQARFIAAANPTAILELVAYIKASSNDQWGAVVLDEEEWAQFERDLLNPPPPNARMIAAAEMLKAYPRGWQTNEVAIVKRMLAAECSEEQVAAAFDTKMDDVQRCIRSIQLEAALLGKKKQ